MKQARLVLALLASCAALFAGPTADARDITVYFQPGVSTNHFTGEVGRYASGSIGISATQGIQFGLVGPFVSLGTDFHLTNQPPPPYTRGLQTFTVAAGLRLAMPVEPVTPIFGVEYANLGVVSNPLNRFTGSRLSYNAIGGHVAARWNALSSVYLEVQVGARYFVDMLSPVASVGGTISIGIAGGL